MRQHAVNEGIWGRQSPSHHGSSAAQGQHALRPPLSAMALAAWLDVWGPIKWYTHKHTHRHISTHMRMRGDAVAAAGGTPSISCRVHHTHHAHLLSSRRQTYLHAIGYKWSLTWQSQQLRLTCGTQSAPDSHAGPSQRPTHMQDPVSVRLTCPQRPWFHIRALAEGGAAVQTCSTVCVMLWWMQTMTPS